MSANFGKQILKKQIGAKFQNSSLIIDGVLCVSSQQAKAFEWAEWRTKFSMNISRLKVNFHLENHLVAAFHR